MYIGKQREKRRIYTAMNLSKDSGVKQRKLPNLPAFKSDLNQETKITNTKSRRRHTESDLLSSLVGKNQAGFVCGITQEVINKIKAAEADESSRQVKMASVQREPNFDEHTDAGRGRNKIAVVQGTSQRIAGIIDIFQDDQGFWIRKIQITKVPGQGLGFFIKKGNGFDRKNGVFISRVSLGSILDIYGLLHTGDEVIEVNRVNLKGFPLEDVALMMQIPDKLLLTTKSRVPTNTRPKAGGKSGQKSSQKSPRVAHEAIFKQLSHGKNEERLLKSFTYSSQKPAKFYTGNENIESRLTKTNNPKSCSSRLYSTTSAEYGRQMRLKREDGSPPVNFSESPDSGIEAPSCGNRTLPGVPVKAVKSPRKLPSPPPVLEKDTNENFTDIQQQFLSTYPLPTNFKRAELYRVQSPEQGESVTPAAPIVTVQHVKDDQDIRQTPTLEPSKTTAKDPRRTLSVSETPNHASSKGGKLGFLRGFSGKESPNNQRKETKVETPAERVFEPYKSDDLNSEMKFTKAFSGMLTVHIESVARMQHSSTKDKFYCTIEIDDEFKASTAKKKMDSSNQSVSFDEQFDVEISHASELSIYVFAIGSSKQHSLVSSGVVFLEKVLNKSNSRAIALELESSGVLNISLDYTEAVKFLKRTPSSRKRGVFGFNIVSTLDVEKNTIPIIVRKCVDEIEKRGLHIVGIYRISGNAKKKKLLKAEFDADSGAVDVSENSGIDCNVLSGIMKDYLRELPEPLIPEQVLQQIIEAKSAATSPDMSKRQVVLCELIKKLPYGSRATLIFIMDHLIRVQENKEVNKMDITNLAVCFGPVLMCPPSTTAVLDFKRIIEALEYLLKIWPKLHERGVEIEISNVI